MIRYALLCRQEHHFEAWFRDSETYESQSGSGQVACPACGSPDVRKAMMAPAVRRSKRPASSAAPAEPLATEPVPTAPVSEVPPPPIADEAFGRVRAALRDFHAHLKRNAEDVGTGFPDQARRIHEGAAPRRAIYGTATDDEVRSLVEDGVGIMPIPVLPEDRN